MEQQLIKVRFKGPECGEHLWAKPLKNNLARLENIPKRNKSAQHCKKISSKSFELLFGRNYQVIYTNPYNQ